MRKTLWGALLTAVSFLVVYHFALCAVHDVGFLLGWITGASKTSVGSTALFVAFGLSALGTLVMIRVCDSVCKVVTSFCKRPEVSRLIVQTVFVVAGLNLASEFVHSARLGIHDGCEVRSND